MPGSRSSGAAHETSAWHCAPWTGGQMTGAVVLRASTHLPASPAPAPRFECSQYKKLPIGRYARLRRPASCLDQELRAKGKGGRLTRGAWDAGAQSATWAPCAGGGGGRQTTARISRKAIHGQAKHGLSGGEKATSCPGERHMDAAMHDSAGAGGRRHRLRRHKRRRGTALTQRVTPDDAHESSPPSPAGCRGCHGTGRLAGAWSDLAPHAMHEE